jgi:hypothetical protein
MIRISDPEPARSSWKGRRVGDPTERHERERLRRLVSERVREWCSAEEAQRRELVIAAYASGRLPKQEPSPWLREQVMHGGGSHRAKGGISSARRL